MIEDLYILLNELKPDVDFRCADNLINEGILESYDIIDIVARIESFYQISVDIFDIIPENFTNAKKIYEMIKRYVEK